MLCGFPRRSLSRRSHQGTSASLHENLSSGGFWVVVGSEAVGWVWWFAGWRAGVCGCRAGEVGGWRGGRTRLGVERRWWVSGRRGWLLAGRADEVVVFVPEMRQGTHKSNVYNRLVNWAISPSPELPQLAFPQTQPVPVPKPTHPAGPLLEPRRPGLPDFSALRQVARFRVSSGARLESETGFILSSNGKS